MNKLTQYLVDSILNEGEEEVVALYGGGFKPPTGGHFEVVKTALQQNPEITNLKILVGSKERDGVDQAEAVLVWEIYTKYLPMKVEIIPSKKPPIGEIYSYAKSNPGQSIYWVIGARKDNEDDFKDMGSRSKGMEKYPNMVLKPIVTNNKGMSGTNARLALKTRNVEEFKKYLPSELSKDDIEEVFQILSPSVDENKTLNESLDLKDRIDYYLNYFINVSPSTFDLSIENDNILIGGFDNPYPPNFDDTKDIRQVPVGDEKQPLNEDILDKTSLVLPRGKKIFLQAESEDYDRGLIVELTEEGGYKINYWYGEDAKVYPVEVVVDGESIKPDAEEVWMKFHPELKKESLNEGRYDTISNRISSDIFNNWKSNISNELIEFNNTYTFEDDEIEIKATLKQSPNFNDYKTDGGAYSEEDSISVEFEIDPEFLPKHWSKISMDLKDIIRHEIEHLTHGEGFQEKPGKYMAKDSTLRNMIDAELLPKSDYFKLEKEIDANLQGMYFRAKKERKPLRNVIDDYLDLQNLTSEEKKEIINIWSKRTKALSLPSINENATYSKNIDYKQQIKDLTKYMLNQKMNIIPLPKVIFKHGNQDNAKNFFGKTAYYDPNTNTIVLFTEGRHPKDIVRSFAHEMIHHIQNLEGRLEDITTTNTQEDDHLTSIEAEAYQDGNLAFRGYTDTVLNENINEAKQVGDLYHFTILNPEGNTGIFKILKDEYIKASNISGGISTTRDKNLDVVSKFYNFKLAGGDSQWEDIDARITLDGDKISNNIKITPTKDILFAKTKNKSHRKKGKKWFSMDEREELIKTSSLPLTPYVKEIQISDLEYLKVFKLLKKLSNIDKFKHLIKLKIHNSSRNQKKFRILSYKEVENMWDEDKKNIPQIVDDIVTPEYVENYKNMLDKNSTSSAMNYKSHNPKDNKRIQKIISQLHFPLSFNTSLIQGKIDSMLKLNEKKNKDPFGLNQYARELAQGLEEELGKTRIPEEEVVSSPKGKDMEYIIYSDMDGVITNFDGRFKKFSNGVSPSEYEKENGKKKFWDLIDNQIGVKFWVGMPWMEDGKEYWDYISKYKPILLSSPSVNNESRLGKRLWVKNNLPGTPLKLAFSRNKKNYAQENAILIDDRENNINQWIASGGVGILHTSASDTIRQLKELGL